MHHGEFRHVFSELALGVSLELLAVEFHVHLDGCAPRTPSGGHEVVAEVTTNSEARSQLGSQGHQRSRNQAHATAFACASV